jgi:hypothetical protein
MPRMTKEDEPVFVQQRQPCFVTILALLLQ